MPWWRKRCSDLHLLLFPIFFFSLEKKNKNFFSLYPFCTFFIGKEFLQIHRWEKQRSQKRLSEVIHFVEDDSIQLRSKMPTGFVLAQN
jgi:hypothetical protein